MPDRFNLIFTISNLMCWGTEPNEQKSHGARVVGHHLQEGWTVFLAGPGPFLRGLASQGSWRAGFC